MSEQFFSGLNYTLANEDSGFEMSILRPKLGHVLSVAGSGARVLPLFASMPKQVSCVDLSKEQLLLTELRIESCKTLTFEDYLSFWGYPPSMEDTRRRRELFQSCTFLTTVNECLSLYLRTETGRLSCTMENGRELFLKLLIFAKTFLVKQFTIYFRTIIFRSI